MWHKARTFRNTLAGAIVVILALWLLKTYSHINLDRVRIPASVAFSTPSSVEKYLSAVKGLATKDFDKLPVSGFRNEGLSGGCESHTHNAMLGVQPSFDLQDNLIQAVRSLSAYPQINRAFEDQQSRNASLTFEGFVETNWAELAGSGVWLPEFQIYLSVSRLIYYPSGDLAVPTISFLRGRIFDSEWNHLDQYTLDWDGELLSFPCFFSLPVEWHEGAAFLGPEDPRVVVEEGVQGAEPVIIFNMMSEQIGWRRAMWMHRPFSNLTTTLTIRGEKPQNAEKNWAPFFNEDDLFRGTQADIKRDPDISLSRGPSHHLNFVYSLQPLRILRCQLLHGHCDWAYEQEPEPEPVPLLPLSLEHAPNFDIRGDMRGGTNFVAVHQSDPAIRLWVGFPRTHVDGICPRSESLYRPELVVLAASGREFHVVYASEALTFGTAVLMEEDVEAPCGDGRILIPNGILRWEQDRHDLMHLAVSVGDRTTQVLRIRGVSKLIGSLPYLSEWRHKDGPDGEPWGRRWSTVGGEIVECSVITAKNWTRKTGEKRVD